MSEKYDLIYLDLSEDARNTEIETTQRWLSIKEEINKYLPLLEDQGIIAIRYLGNFSYFIKLCVDSQEKSLKFLNEIFIRNHLPDSEPNSLIIDETERIYVFKKDTLNSAKKTRYINPIYSDKESKPPSWHGFDSKGQGKKMNFSISDTPLYLAPPVGTHWKWTQDKITKGLQNYNNLPDDLKNDDSKFFNYIKQYRHLERTKRPRFLRLSKNNKPYYLVYGEPLLVNSFWDDIPSSNIIDNPTDSTVKKSYTSKKLIERLANCFTNDSESILLVCNYPENKIEIANRKIDLFNS